ncbi:Cy168 [Cynomolgus cytomegalovirus]|nr:Cy168 [Cynomolgus cytomegalovirus]
MLTNQEDKIIVGLVLSIAIVVILLFLYLLIFHVRRVGSVCKDIFTCYCFRSLVTRIRGEKFDSEYRNVYLRENLKRFAQDYKRVLIMCPPASGKKIPTNGVSIEMDEAVNTQSEKIVTAALPAIPTSRSLSHADTETERIYKNCEKVNLMMEGEYAVITEVPNNTTPDPPSSSPYATIFATDMMQIPNVTPEMAAVIETAVRSTLQMLMKMQPQVSSEK